MRKVSRLLMEGAITGERNLKLVLEYDGTDFYGWQIQPGCRTVQDTIEGKLQILLRHPVRLISAGRTDTGVHALGQVANFLTTSPLPASNIRRGLNGLLEKDVIVRSIEEVPLAFHSRFDALSRRYSYKIVCGRRAIGRRYCWELNWDIAVEEMDQATKSLVGRHDFSSFCASGSSLRNHFCRVLSCSWSKDNDEICFDIEADRFLYGMVRTIVGTAADIGRHKFAPETMKEILDAKDRRRAGMTAPARGLCLVEVRY